MRVAIPAGARSAIDVALGFVREHMPESSTRLCAVLLCLTGCCCALGTVIYAFAALRVDPTGSHASTVTALVGVSSALIASGCVAIVNRTEKSDAPGTSGDA